MSQALPLKSILSLRLRSDISDFSQGWSYQTPKGGFSGGEDGGWIEAVPSFVSSIPCQDAERSQACRMDWPGKLLPGALRSVSCELTVMSASLYFLEPLLLVLLNIGQFKPPRGTSGVTRKQPGYSVMQCYQMGTTHFVLCLCSLNTTKTCLALGWSSV